MFKLDQVKKIFDGVSVLEDVTCNIPTDEFVFILGPSGAGKSTLLRMLAFLEFPESGVIQLDLDGVNYKSTASPRPWPKLTSVFQKQFLWPHMTLMENIALPARLRNPEIAHQLIESVIELFEMADFINRYPNEVSGGQAQRAALARAFVLHPQIIIIDEAHSGLDLEQQEILNGHMTSLRKQGVGLIVVTHSLETALQLGDSFFVVEQGRISDHGGKEVLCNPRSAFLQRVIAGRQTSLPKPMMK